MTGVDLVASFFGAGEATPTSFFGALAAASFRGDASFFNGDLAGAPFAAPSLTPLSAPSFLPAAVEAADPDLAAADAADPDLAANDATGADLAAADAAGADFAAVASFLTAAGSFFAAATGSFFAVAVGSFLAGAGFEAATAGCFGAVAGSFSAEALLFLAATAEAALAGAADDFAAGAAAGFAAVDLAFAVEVGDVAPVDKAADDGPLVSFFASFAEEEATSVGVSPGAFFPPGAGLRPAEGGRADFSFEGAAPFEAEVADFPAAAAMTGGGGGLPSKPRIASTSLSRSNPRASFSGEHLPGYKRRVGTFFVSSGYQTRTNATEASSGTIEEGSPVAGSTSNAPDFHWARKAANSGPSSAGLIKYMQRRPKPILQ